VKLFETERFWCVFNFFICSHSPYHHNKLHLPRFSQDWKKKGTVKGLLRGPSENADDIRAKAPNSFLFSVFFCFYHTSGSLDNKTNLSCLIECALMIS